MSSENSASPNGAANWPAEIFATLKRFEVGLVAYVPDAGHSDLIKRVHADNDMRPALLTTEEEGIGLLAGGWLGGKRGVLLMQSSGVGNCLNMLSLVKLMRLPLLTLVTMRGEWGEFNPWQVPMGSTTQQAFEMMDVQVLRADAPEKVGETVEAAAKFAFEGGTPTAVLLAQRLVGTKSFVK